jgi:hypothetical protein
MGRLKAAQCKIALRLFSVYPSVVFAEWCSRMKPAPLASDTIEAQYFNSCQWLALKAAGGTLILSDLPATRLTSARIKRSHFRKLVRSSANASWLRLP